MTKLVRNGCFETNSSSCHSISIADDAAKPYTTIYPNEQGVIAVHPDEFGWDIEYYYTPEKKLSYLLIYIRDWVEEENKARFNEILERVVLTHTKASSLYLIDDGTDVWNNGYIDHQSVESQDYHYLFEDKTLLKNFLFHPDSYLKTDNDNHD